MTTIYTRAALGQALTWTQGDANITNLNNDKIELTDLSVSTGAASSGGSLSYSNTTGEFTFAPADLSTYLTDITNESIGDLSDVDLTSIADGDSLVWDSANSKFIASSQVSTTINGSVTDIDDVRNPNTLTLSNTTGISANDNIDFFGTDCAAVGLTSGSSSGYYIWADIGGGAYEIGFSGSVVSLTDIGTITDLTYSVTPAGSGGGGGTALNDLTDVNVSGVTDGQVLTYNNGTSQWQPQTPSTGLTTVSGDTNPSLGGDLNGNNYTISNVNLQQYRETVYNLGSTDSPSLDYSNGNVQSVTITSGLSLPTFSGASTGQSMTLLVTGSGTATGASGYKFAGGATTLTNYSVISIFYDGTTYWASISTDFQ